MYKVIKAATPFSKQKKKQENSSKQIYNLDDYIELEYNGPENTIWYFQKDKQGKWSMKQKDFDTSNKDQLYAFGKGLHGNIYHGVSKDLFKSTGVPPHSMMVGEPITLPKYEGREEAYEGLDDYVDECCDIIIKALYKMTKLFDDEAKKRRQAYREREKQENQSTSTDDDEE